MIRFCSHLSEVCRLQIQQVEDIEALSSSRLSIASTSDQVMKEVGFSVAGWLPTKSTKVVSVGRFSHLHGLISHCPEAGDWTRIGGSVVASAIRQQEWARAL